MQPEATILAVDDDADALFALEGVLTRAGYKVVTAANGKDALCVMQRLIPDLILLDLMMPLMNGYEVAQAVKADPVLKYTPVVLVTSKDDCEDIVRGLDAGADDYIKKPFRKEELLARIKAAMRTRRLYRELEQERESNQALRIELGARYSFDHILGNSASMREVFSLIHKVKDAVVPVLITGESGTGKELVARAVHCNGARSKGPFVVQNCSAFQENLLESELFGHVRGAFTGANRDKAGLFEAADGGTFFLDELGEMSPALQVKLLRVLQDGTFIPVGATRAKKVDVRIIAATNRNLREMVRRGTFREDLFYRLNVVNIVIPPLRERRLDIPLLVEHFLAEAGAGQGARKTLSSEALRALCEYDWPGNVRELQNEVERAVLLSASEEKIQLSDLSPHIAGGQKEASEQAGRVEGSLKEAVANLERNLILAALERHDWNKSEVARDLGISRSNLIAKVSAYGLERVR